LELSDFLDKPPTISALYASKENTTNVLNFIKNKNNDILFVKDDSVNTLSVDEDIIHFSNEIGFEVDSILQSGRYYNLTLKESQVVFTVSKQKFEEYNLNNKFIVLKGKAKLYHKGKFSKIIEIEKNQIK